MEEEDEVEEDEVMGEVRNVASVQVMKKLKTCSVKVRLSITNEEGVRVPFTATEMGGAVHRVKRALERERFSPSFTLTSKTDPAVLPPCVRVMEVKVQGVDGLEDMEKEEEEMERREEEEREMVEKDTSFNMRMPCDASMRKEERVSEEVP